MQRSILVLTLSLTLLLVWVAPANAYIDPGSTTIVFQAIIAGVAAAGLTLKMSWARLASAFRRRRPDESDA